jgi:hypothetical protein
MKTKLLMTATVLTAVLAVSFDAHARDVYPERSLGDIYVLSTEGGRALLKAKGAEKEYVAIGDVIGEDRMAVVKIDGLSVAVESQTGDTATRLPVGGGLGY